MRRRMFLGALLASASLPAPGWADAGDPAFLAAARTRDGAHVLFGLTATGDDLFAIPLPDRGHAAAAHPTASEAVAFARRPGRFALVIDCVSGRVTHRLTAPPGRHFYGHGAFVADGEILVTTENHVESGTGRLGLWARSDGYARLGEVASGGIGPHEILALPDDSLVVANGGIRTHPDHGRDKLNLDRMRPNLSYLTLEGGVSERVELDPELHKASIRHLAAQDGQVAFAMQWQGEPTAAVPLLGLHRRGTAPRLCAADLAEQIALNGYAGSVAISGDRVVLTAPRGGRTHVFGTDGRFRGAIRRRDVCGVAGGPSGMILTDGGGGILRIDGSEIRPLRVADRAWDNHLVRIGGY